MSGMPILNHRDYRWARAQLAQIVRGLGADGLIAGITSQYYSPRVIGACAGAITSTTAIFWAWAHYTGRLPEPRLEGVDPGEVEVHGEQTV